MATISQLSIRSSPPTGVIIARRVMSVSTSAYSENENSKTPPVKPIMGNRHRRSPVCESNANAKMTAA